MKPTVDFRINVRRVTLKHIAGNYLTYTVEFRDKSLSNEFMNVIPSGCFIFKEGHNDMLTEHAKEQIEHFKSYYSKRTGAVFSKENDEEKHLIVHGNQATQET